MNTDVSKVQIQAMVNQYRANPSGGINPGTGQQQPITHFTHFPLVQIVQWLVSNNVVALTDTVDTILNTKGNSGIKLYYAQHVAVDDCPDNDADYIGRNTIVLVSTRQEDGLWYDLLADGSVTAIAAGDDQVGTDKSKLCPPQCNLFPNSL